MTHSHSQPVASPSSHPATFPTVDGAQLRRGASYSTHRVAGGLLTA